MKKYYKKIQSPVDELILIADDKYLLAILWGERDQARVNMRDAIENNKHPILVEAHKQLQDYFKGKRKTFELPLQFKGTEFQEKVWKGLLTIPYGKTVSYQWLAKKVGSDKAMRAVGSANGKNPLSIVVPCHRVIGANGSLTGFAGGLNNKKFLLELESHAIN